MRACEETILKIDSLINRTRKMEIDNSSLFRSEPEKAKEKYAAILKAVKDLGRAKRSIRAANKFFDAEGIKE